MSTFAAKVVGGLPRGGGAQQQHQQTGGGPQQRNGGGPVKSNPVRQTVGFSVTSNADRLGFIGNVLVGYKVEVQVASGVVYEGVFGSWVTDSNGAQIVLKYAKVIKDASSASDRTALAEKPVTVLTIAAGDLVQLYAKDVRLSPEDLSGADRSDVGFETDAAISRGRGGGVRELQRWQPDAGDDSAFFSLESAGGGAGWDQFAVNRDRFGVQTTWNEHFYTTKIKRDECRITDAEAERIAREIETGLSGGATTNIHMLEERGGELAADVDEEALYGAVIREHQPGPMPAYQQQHRQHQRSRGPQQSAADRATAWGRVGSGVAAVAGGLTVAQQQQAGVPGIPDAKSSSIPVPVPTASSSAGGAPPTDGGSGSAGSSTAGGTAPIDIDPRKEVNKVRSSLTVGPKKDRSSPFGTPKMGMSRSPVFASPLVGNPVSFSALDLDPGAPQQVRLDPEAQAEFLRFKEEMNKKRSGNMGTETSLADFKKSSSSFKERSGVASGSGSAAAPGSAEQSVAGAATGLAGADGAAAPAAAAGAAAGVGPAAAAPNGEEAEPKPASKLNPNAKPFSLNINAKEFVPSFGPPKVPAPAAAPSVPVAVGSAVVSTSVAPPASVATVSGPSSNAPPAVAAAQAAATALSSGQASYLAGGPSHGLAVTYHHSSTGHGHQGQQGQYGHAGQGSMHAGHGHGGVHHERGYGGGSNGPMGRDMRDHGGMYHRGQDPYRSGGNGNDGGGYRGGGDPFRGGAQPGSGDGYHQHHHQHHKGGAGGPGEHHLGNKGSDGHGGGLHKVPPPPPQGPMSAEGPMGAMIMNGVGPGGMTTHGMVPMTQAMAANMSSMGAVPYGVVMAPPGGYMTSGMPPGAVAMASTANGPVPIMYAVRPAGGGHAMAMGPGMAMMSGSGMASPYGAAVGPYMTAPPGGMPPLSPTGRPQSTGFFQPPGSYPMIATAHPGGPHGHPGGHMGSQPGGPMGSHHMMQGHGHGHHGHGPMGHMQDGRMGQGGGPKGGGRQGGGGHRPPRMDHDRSGQGPRDMD